MSTYRVADRRTYTLVDNEAVRDKSLSFKARGIHHLLLSYPDNWVINLKHLIQQSDKDGRDAIRTGLIELEKAGYIVKRQNRSDNGKFAEADYDIFEVPRKAENDSSDDEEAVDGKSDDGKTVSGKSGRIINTERRINKKRNTERRNTNTETPKPPEGAKDDRALPPTEKQPEPEQQQITANAPVKRQGSTRSGETGSGKENIPASGGDDFEARDPNAATRPWVKPRLNKAGMPVRDRGKAWKDHIINWDLFQKFLKRYRALCELCDRNPGSADDAAMAWVYLEHRNFFGEGIAGFGKGFHQAEMEYQEQKAETGEAFLYTAHKFLWDGGSEEPIWRLKLKS